MQFGVALIAVVLPLIITPGLFFAFDLTPKIAALVFGTCVLLWFCASNPKAIRGVTRSRYGRWFLGLLAAQGIVLAVASAISLSPDLSLHGSGWRRFGLLTQSCCILIALAVCAWIAQSPPRTRTVLRMITGAGIIGAVYGILQYFGWDPWIAPQSYQSGEGIFMIVRPPGPMGHADYFAAWLVLVFFAGLALTPLESSREMRAVACAATALAAVAILLSGTRSALLGLLAGVAVYLLLRRPRLTRRTLVSAAAVAACFVLFLASPPGDRLRARVHWSAEDLRGGARLLLWRDSLAMSAQRPGSGYGPETFSVAFPAYQSLDLARAYPDFYHESPHNVFLDALTGQGVAGLLATAALAVYGFFACARLERRYAAPLAAGWMGVIVCHQFVVFVAPTAAYFYLWLALLAGNVIERETREMQPVSGRAWFAYPVTAAAGFLFAAYAIRLMVADRAQSAVQAALEAGDVQAAVRAYDSILAWEPKGARPDLYYSRIMADFAARMPSADSRSLAWSQAIAAGRRAALSAEDRPNARYSLASLLAAQNDAGGAEQALRDAIAAAPNWYKPHWTLARLLALSGRAEEALAEARLAVDRGGGQHAEVVETLRQLERKPAGGP